MASLARYYTPELRAHLHRVAALFGSTHEHLVLLVEDGPEGRWGVVLVLHLAFAEYALVVWRIIALRFLIVLHFKNYNKL